MRHIWSLLAGVVAAPLAWLFLATGQHRSTRVVEGWDDSGTFDTADLIGPAIYLVAAGILLGVLGTLRWSPAGPLATGLIFVLPTIFMFLDPFRTLDAFSFDETRRLFGQDYQPWLPLQNGTLLVLGALLLIAVFSAQRWRHWPTRPAPLPAATDQGVGAHSEQPQEHSMSDEEILAAAAAMDEQAGGTGEPAAEAPPSAPEPETKPDTGNAGEETRPNESEPR